jgi:hypothetical protein
MENKIQVPKRVYTFRRDQVVTGDVRGFLREYDPFRLSNSRLAELAGNLLISFEGAEDMCVVSTHPELRVLLRRLHAIWPWSAYFLDLDRPIGPSSFLNDKPLLAIGLSIADVTLCYRRATDHLQITCGPQLQQFYNTCHDVANRLGIRAGLSTQQIANRHLAIHNQFKDVLP